MRKHGDKPKQKINFQSVINTRMELVYIYEPENGYLWTDYVNREDLLEVPGDDFTHLIQAIKNDRSEKSKSLFPPDS